MGVFMKKNALLVEKVFRMGVVIGLFNTFGREIEHDEEGKSDT